MIQQVKNFEQKKLAHYNKIKKSQMNDIQREQLNIVQSSCRLQKLDSQQIIKYLSQLILQRKQISRNESKYLWMRVVGFKQEYQNYKNRNIFNQLSHLIGTQINSKTYYILKNKGINKFTIQDFQTTRLWKKRVSRNTCGTCQHTHYYQQITKYIKLKHNGVFVASFLLPEVYIIPAYNHQISFEQYLIDQLNKITIKFNQARKVQIQNRMQ